MSRLTGCAAQATVKGETRGHPLAAGARERGHDPHALQHRRTASDDHRRLGRRHRTQPASPQHPVRAGPRGRTGLHPCPARHPRHRRPVFGGSATGDTSASYTVPNLSYKQDFTNNISAAIIIDTPFGLDLAYPGSSVAFGGTNATVDTAAITGVLRYKMDSGFGAHAGLRYQTAEADLELTGAAYGGLSGYSANFDSDSAVGWLAGISWERPDIAARVSLTFNSAIEHDFDTTEAGLPVGNGESATAVKTPRSWNLEFQTGVAQDTLVFGSVRWVKWSEFRVNPVGFTSFVPDGIVQLEDTTTFNLGVGRRFTENWSGLASVLYETDSDGLVSPLAPYSGRKGITLGAVYTQGNVRVTGGISYVKLGDTDTRPEVPPGVGAAQMRDNEAIAIGLRTAFTF
ncbi:OmpP1/FadL family transporter [Paracoccus sp. S-4012]|uniref:OmpP1/FadL family transporter n=1 Tax=Paracoccus sp. S-4012 TaxID=2665648 RepID=UPI001E31F14E|nr:outer membrane protein transport protein [Paracoccus sp. S-4012]